MDVDPKSQSLDALIQADKGSKKQNNRPKKQNNQNQGVRDKQAPRPRFNDARRGGRPDERLRARRTGNMIQKQRGDRQVMNQGRPRRMNDDPSFKVSVIPILILCLFLCLR